MLNCFLGLVLFRAELSYLSPNIFLTKIFGFLNERARLTPTRLSATGAFTYPATTATRPHAPLSLGSRSFAYDANGNTTDDGVRALTWDDANRLAQVTGSGMARRASPMGPTMPG